jgi:hypothetical protein
MRCPLPSTACARRACAAFFLRGGRGAADECSASCQAELLQQADCGNAVLTTRNSGCHGIVEETAADTRRFAHDGDVRAAPVLQRLCCRAPVLQGACCCREPVAAGSLLLQGACAAGS